jgi:hypothetical protein
MRLELCWFDVEDAVAASATRLSGHRLDVDLDALCLFDWILAGEPGGVIPLAAGEACEDAGQRAVAPRESGR